MDVGVQHLAAATRAAFATLKSAPNALMLTPTVLEIIAIRN